MEKLPTPACGMALVLILFGEISVRCAVSLQKGVKQMIKKFALKLTKFQHKERPATELMHRAIFPFLQDDCRGTEKLRRTSTVFHTLYITDGKHRLTGTVELRKLLTCKPGTAVSALAKWNPVSSFTETRRNMPASFRNTLALPARH